MPGKSKKKKYGEFRVFVEWRRRGKWAIRPEFVPSLAAWLLMLGRRYERMIAGMKDRQAVEHIPGLEESVKTLEICTQHIQRLLNFLNEHFDNDDWRPAVAEVCELMRIEPNSKPLEYIPEGQFDHMIEEPISGDDTR